jgi:hypothetical protein
MRSADCLRIVAILLFTFAPRIGHSGDTAGLITELLVSNDFPDRVLVRLTGSNTALPACSTANNRYVLDSSTNTGKQIYASLLSAVHTGTAVTLLGFDTCSLVSNSESLRALRINPP